MSLAIAELDTTCRIKASGKAKGEARAFADRVDRVAREHLAAEIAACLGPSLDHDGSVVRIRRLDVHVPVDRLKFDNDTFGRQWALAFTRALFQALAYPEGHPAVEVCRYSSEAGFYAAYLEAIVNASAESLWEFRDFEAFPSVGEVLLHLAKTAEHPLLSAVVAHLEAKGKLVPVLAAIDELTIESILRIESERAGTAPQPFSATFLIAIVQALERVKPVGRWRLADHRQALRLWGLAEPQPNTPAITPRYMLWALQALSEIELLWRITVRSGDVAAAAWIVRRSPELPQIVSSFLASLTPTSGAIHDDRATALTEIARRMRALQPSPQSMEAVLLPSTQQIQSDWMGLLLLTRTIERLDWWQRLVVSGKLTAFGRERAFHYVLLGVGCTIVNYDWERRGDPDPAVSLFAGILSEPDMAGLRAFVAESDPKLLDAIHAGRPIWQEAFQQAADLLIAEFLDQIRGFRRSSLRFARDQFLHRSGEALVDQRDIWISMAPNSWSSAWRLAGIDQTLEAPWFEPRRLHFHLEGL